MSSSNYTSPNGVVDQLIAGDSKCLPEEIAAEVIKELARA